MDRGEPMKARISIILLFIFIYTAVLCFAFKMDRITVDALSRCFPATVVLDAGHGGEDGGAAAKDGTNEKDLNLQIAQSIASYFDWFGIRYVSVRENDSLIGDNTLPTIRERKVSDLRKRMQIVNETPNAILLSIHQNYYISEKYCGTQVFYAPKASGSSELADCIQRDICNALQPDNTRKIKPTEGTVFLLDKAEKTSVMVECGFLSNDTEANKLKDISYQSQLAYYMTRGLCDYINNINTYSF